MDTVRLDRQQTSPMGTFGRLFLPQAELFTGELPWRDNRPGVSCIPEGDYPCRWSVSGRYGHIYGVFDVPDRQYIRLHNGNFCGDREVGLLSHVEGCILLGQAFGRIQGQQAILLSRPALSQFHAILAEQPFTLEVRNNGLF